MRPQEACIRSEVKAGGGGWGGHSLRGPCALAIVRRGSRTPSSAAVARPLKVPTLSCMQEEQVGKNIAELRGGAMSARHATAPSTDFFFFRCLPALERGLMETMRALVLIGGEEGRCR